MKMNMNQTDFYSTSDLALSTTVALFYPIEAIDRQESSRKAYFVFKREQALDELVESYWRGELKVNPQAYFNQLRVIKARLYSQE